MKGFNNTKISRVLGLLALAAAVAGVSNIGAAHAAAPRPVSGPCLACPAAAPFSMDTAQSHIWVQPGLTIIFPLTLTNLNTSATAVLDIKLAAQDDQLAGVGLSQSEVLLPTGKTATVWAKIQVPDKATTWLDNVTVKAETQDNFGNSIIL